MVMIYLMLLDYCLNILLYCNTNNLELRIFLVAEYVT